MKKTQFSKPLLERVPLYLKCLCSLQDKEGTISATTIAQMLKLGEVQVRKDLNVISGSGRPKIGYKINELIQKLEEFIGRTKVVNVVLVGAGKLGMALYGYKGFANYGVNICAAFDVKASEGQPLPNGKVYSMDCFSEFVHENNIKIGIIAVPEQSAQEVADIMVASSIKAIWNFAPCRIETPEGVIVKSENMAASLALLASAFKE